MGTSVIFNTEYNNKIYRKKSEKVKYGRSFRIAVVLTVFMLFYAYLTLFTQNIESSYPGYIAIGMTLLMDAWIFLQIAIKDAGNKVAIGFLVIFALLSALSCLMNNSGVHKILTLYLMLLCVYLFSKEPLSFREAQYLFWIIVGATILFLLKTARGGEDSVSANRFNPNAGGFRLAVLYCASLAILLKHEDFLHRLPYFIVCLACIALQFVFVSRTAMIGILLYTFMVILFGVKKSFGFKTAFVAVIALSVLGLLIAFVYSEILYRVIGHGKIVILGKDIFTGRQTIWNFAFESIRENFWFGVGGHLNEEQFDSGFQEWIMDAHNQPLGTLAAYGIFIFVAFYVALACFIALLYKNKGANQPRINRMPLIFMLTMTVMSYFEIFFMSLFGLLPVLAGYATIIGTAGIQKKRGKRYENHGIYADF